MAPFLSMNAWGWGHLHANKSSYHAPALRMLTVVVKTCRIWRSPGLVTVFPEQVVRSRTHVHPVLRTWIERGERCAPF